MTEYLIAEIYYLPNDDVQFKVVFLEGYLRSLIEVAKEDKDVVFAHINALSNIDLGKSAAIVLGEGIEKFKNR